MKILNDFNRQKIKLIKSRLALFKRGSIDLNSFIGELEGLCHMMKLSPDYKEKIYEILIDLKSVKQI